MRQLFREEIKKSYHEYSDQVGKEFADTTEHFRNALNEILAHHSGRSHEEIAKASDRDYYMTALEAKAFGIVDDLLTKPPGSEEAENDD